MTNTTDRIAALEQEYADLRAGLADMRARLDEVATPKPAPVSKPTQHRSVTITQLTPVASADAMPNAAEFEQLQAIILRNLQSSMSSISRRTNFIFSLGARSAG